MGREWDSNAVWEWTLEVIKIIQMGNAEFCKYEKIDGDTGFFAKVGGTFFGRQICYEYAPNKNRQANKIKDRGGHFIQAKSRATHTHSHLNLGGHKHTANSPNRK